MNQIRTLHFENENWILRYYDEDEELIVEQFATLDDAKAHILTNLKFPLNFEPNLN